MKDLVKEALAEDIGKGDATSKLTVPRDVGARARIDQKAPGLIAGLEVAEAVFREVDRQLRFMALTSEGQWNDAGPVCAIEGEARGVWNYESLYVPGLVQTEDYARAVIRGGFPSASRDEIERRVQVRMERQDVLRGDRPLELWGIVDEAALRRQVGGREVMRGQLRYLLEAAELPQVTLQVIPFSAGAHAGMPGSFVFMQFAEAAIPDVVYIDSMADELFLEEESDVRRYKLVFEHLRAVAESPDAARSLIAGLVAQM